MTQCILAEEVEQEKVKKAKCGDGEAGCGTNKKVNAGVKETVTEKQGRAHDILYREVKGKKRREKERRTKCKYIEAV